MLGKQRFTSTLTPSSAPAAALALLVGSFVRDVVPALGTVWESVESPSRLLISAAPIEEAADFRGGMIEK